MRILNATKSVKTLMSDIGTLITVKPGELSAVMIASRNLITSAMKLGEPNEIGIIVSGSYELDITKTISGAVPYLYTDENEAISKLIDPNINYKEGLKKNLADTELKLAIKEKDDEILLHKGRIKSLESEIEKLKSDKSNAALVTEFNTLQSKYNALQAEKMSLDSQNKESKDEMENLNKKLSELRESNGSLSQELSAINSAYSKLVEEKKLVDDELAILKSNQQSNDSEEVDKLKNDFAKANEEIANLNSELSTTKSEYDSLAKKAKGLEANDKAWKDLCDSKDEEIKKFKESLEEASNTIESMRSEFNKACEQFQITKDENGNWIQITE